MYTNQYTPQYFQYIQQYQQCPSNNYQMYNYNQHPAYSTPQPTQTSATFIRPTVPVQQPQASTPVKKVSRVWMGSVEYYMTESFITSAFQKMGEYPKNVKLVRDKHTGENAGYAYVDLYDPVSVMKKLNGKYIPGANPPVKFKLNHAGSPGKTTASGRDFSVWLGELSPGVDDYQLYKTFACRYSSIRTAKVVLDSAGFSKGYGFINFGIEEEQKHFLNNMNGFPGLGSKPIKVSSVIPKSKRYVASNDFQEYKASQNYGQYFETDCWRVASGIWLNLERNRDVKHKLEALNAYHSTL
ncbi:tRNA selenocysteine 1-associated protein 1-like [Acyrthosiphon pisum]|uniref:tRNA selenocysteine-associated protein 1 n=1 Tax=Acyrthosiphon pisum TaxID=7029 RepID=A0A8R2A1X8_ACYPI|nr:tRNA selenocysteine 1-associated protein 1-like [Acyrthosiphon pisum]|eukprot:XP_001947545.2 PREDICTED: tRNA selenocysteine 1-associated protein 1-like [Acyrthosiphon pisum]